MVMFHKTKDKGTVSHPIFSCKRNTKGRVPAFLNILRWFFLHENQDPILENNFRSPLTCYIIQNSRLPPICSSTRFFLLTGKFIHLNSISETMESAPYERNYQARDELVLTSQLSSAPSAAACLQSFVVLMRTLGTQLLIDHFYHYSICRSQYC